MCRRIPLSRTIMASAVLMSVVTAGRLVADESLEAVDHAKSLSRAFRHAASAAAPAVVTIVSKVKAPRSRAETMRELLEDPRFRRLFPDGEVPFDVPFDSGTGEDHLPLLDSHVGSGVVIDSSGVILTNSHVVEDADEVIIRFRDGREVKAIEIKRDPLSDLAIVRVPRDDKLRAASLGDSDKLDIGDWVIAIGSPFELETTVSAGIISGQGRSLEQIQRAKLLQTDAAINPGNSGGPLVNLNGEVIGINTAIATNSGGYQGIGFAIPVNHAKWVVRQLVTSGTVQRAYLGIRIEDVTPQVAARLNVPVRSGVAITQVIPGTPAAEGGLQDSDVIIQFGGQSVSDSRGLQVVVEKQPVGSKQPVKLLRNGKPTQVFVTVRPFPAAEGSN